MFGLFNKKVNKKASKVVTRPAVPAFIKVRSFRGATYHIVETPGCLTMDCEATPAMCGYDNWAPINTAEEVTDATVTAPIARPYENWHWCGGCLNEFLT